MKTSQSIEKVSADRPVSPVHSIAARRIAFGLIGGLQSLAVAAAVLAGGVIAGCTIPSDCGDLDYPTYGGAWERTRRDGGRVGSIFDPAGARVSSLAPRDGEEESGDLRSPRESILSAPPGGRSDLQRSESESREASEPRQPSPSDRLDRDKLQSLDLDDIDIESGAPLPPDLN
jgi:hypothetical protein